MDILEAFKAGERSSEAENAMNECRDFEMADIMAAEYYLEQKLKNNA